MSTATAALEIVSTGDIAERFGVDIQAVRRVLDRIGLGRKVGRYRVVAKADLDHVELALRAAGYLDPTTSRPPSSAVLSGLAATAAQEQAPGKETANLLTGGLCGSDAVAPAPQPGQPPVDYYRGSPTNGHRSPE